MCVCVCVCVIRDGGPRWRVPHPCGGPATFMICLGKYYDINNIHILKDFNKVHQ